MATDSKDLAIRVDEMMLARMPRMEAMLIGTGINPEKFRYLATSQLAKKDDAFRAVVQQNPQSFVSAVCEAAEQGLDFSKANEAHLVPFKDKSGKPVIVLFRGYKGIAKMARRSPNVADVEAVTVYEKDLFKVIQGSERKIIHEPPAFGQERGEIVGFYAIAFLKSGPPVFDVMSTPGIEHHAHRFIKAMNGPFTAVKNQGRNAENFEAYGLKTVLVASLVGGCPW